MDAEPIGKVLSRLLLPYVQNWAERSGIPLLSQLAVDDQFRGLVERYGEQVLAGMTRRAASKPEEAEHPDPGATLAQLQQRVAEMESQQERQRVLFEMLSAKIRPFALALGCCPDCFVGIPACPTCRGRSTVGCYEPDHQLLETHVIEPLLARGVVLVLNESPDSAANARRRESTPRKRTKNGRGNDARESALGE